MNGIRKGDAVAIHLPMLVETVVALLAIGRIERLPFPYSRVTVSKLSLHESMPLVQKR